MFESNLTTATQALVEGTLAQDVDWADPPESSLLSARDFATWAQGVMLPRPIIGATREERWSTAYTNPVLDVANQVIHRYYRYRKDGGTYDPDDPATHPLPGAVKQMIRDLGMKLDSEVNLIYKLVRDPRIPVGRRKRGSGDALP